MTRRSQVHAVVLSGGAGYAAYELGVLRALLEGDARTTRRQAIDGRIVTGTSAGAYNAALLCSVDAGASARTALDYLEDVWLHGIAGLEDCGNNVVRFRANPTTFLDGRCADSDRAGREWAADVEFLSAELAKRAQAFVASSANLQQRVLEAIDVSLVLSVDRFAALVAETIDAANIRASARALRIAATNWRTGELRVFRNEEMTDACAHDVVMASAATPAMFPTVEIGGEPYADGALVMNTPLSPAIEAGADTVHVIYMDPHSAQVPLARLRSTSSSLYRLTVIAQAAMMNRDIDVARRINLGLDVAHGLATPDDGDDYRKGYHLVAQRQASGAGEYRRLAIHRYHPHEDPGGSFRWLSFDRDQILRLMELGYRDAVRHDCGERECLVEDVA